MIDVRTCEPISATRQNADLSNIICDRVEYEASDLPPEAARSFTPVQGRRGYERFAAERT